MKLDLSILTALKLYILCTVVHFIGYSYAQQLPQCLQHRIDVVGCKFRHPQTTAKPAKNEWGMYSTRIKQGPKCDIRRRNHRVGKIQTIGGDPRVKLIYSPGFSLNPPQKYGNQMIVFYDIACPPNHVSFFNITHIDMEPPNCQDPNAPTLKCVDYVRVEHGLNGEFGTTESCGVDPQLNREILTSGDLRVTFRTGDKGRFLGFRSVLICVNTTENNGDGNRRKRSLQQTFYEEMEGFIESVRRYRESLSNLGLLERIEQWFPSLVRIDSVVIQFGQSFSYANNMLRISDSLMFSLVQLLKVIDAEGVRTFETGAQGVIFQGPGNLTIAGSTAFYKGYIANPEGIVTTLTDEERGVLNELSAAYYEQVVEPPETRLCDEFLNPPPIDFDNLPLDDPVDDDLTIPECPKPSVTTTTTCNYTDAQLKLALDNMESQSVLVRSMVDVMVDCTRRAMPGRIERISNTVDVSCDITTSDSNTFMVQCSSNRDSEVRVARCFVVDTQDQHTVQLSQYCAYPTFTFSVLDASISTGEQQLIIEFVDQQGSTSTEVLHFNVPAGRVSPACLLSLLECTFRSPAAAHLLGANEVGIFSTRISTGPTCTILRRNARILKIPSHDASERVKLIGADVRNVETSVYVLFNVSCPPGHFTFFNLTSINMEGPNCFNPATQQMQCSDYLRVWTPGFGYADFCGSDPSGGIVVGGRNMKILLRTGSPRAVAVFTAFVICASRPQTTPGHTAPTKGATYTTPIQGGGGGYTTPTQSGGQYTSRPTQGGGGYTRPTEGGGEGYTRPTQGGGRGYTRPTQGGGGGYTRPVDDGGYGRKKRSLEDFGVILTPEEVAAINSGVSQAQFNFMTERLQIGLAIMNAYSSNPLVRTSSESAIELIKRHNPNRLQQLTDELPHKLDSAIDFE